MGKKWYGEYFRCTVGAYDSHFVPLLAWWWCQRESLRGSFSVISRFGQRSHSTFLLLPLCTNSRSQYERFCPQRNDQYILKDHSREKRCQPAHMITFSIADIRFLCKRNRERWRYEREHWFAPAVHGYDLQGRQDLFERRRDRGSADRVAVRWPAHFLDHLDLDCYVPAL